MLCAKKLRGKRHGGSLKQKPTAEDNAAGHNSKKKAPPGTMQEGVNLFIFHDFVSNSICFLALAM
jgi:hypothetical protein